MDTIFETVMRKLYGKNIWDGFTPTHSEAEISGWNGRHPSLSRLASISHNSNIVIDVGVWKGQSTVTLAKAMKDTNINGAVIAIDTFLGSPEHWDGAKRSRFERIFGLPDLYQTFLSNVISAGVQNFVIPLPQTSSTAAKILRSRGIKASIIHVDAAHEYREALCDFNDYWDLLEDGGYLIGDDYHRNWPGVIEAAGEFSAKHKRALIVEGQKFILQK